MAGLEKIIDRIEKESSQKTNEIILVAKKQADDMIRAAVNSANQKSLSEEKKALHEAEEIESRTRSGVDLEKRKMTLSAKRQVIDGIYTEVENSVKNLPREKYIDFLVNSVSGEKLSGEMIFAENDKEISERTAALLTKMGAVFSGISFTDAIDGGFIIKKGAVSIDCSLKEILFARKEELEKIIVDAVF